MSAPIDEWDAFSLWVSTRWQRLVARLLTPYTRWAGRETKRRAEWPEHWEMTPLQLSFQIVNTRSDLRWRLFFAILQSTWPVLDAGILGQVIAQGPYDGWLWLDLLSGLTCIFWSVSAIARYVRVRTRLAVLYERATIHRELVMASALAPGFRLRSYDARFTVGYEPDNL